MVGGELETVSAVLREERSPKWVAAAFYGDYEDRLRPQMLEWWMSSENLGF